MRKARISDDQLFDLLCERCLKSCKQPRCVKVESCSEFISNDEDEEPGAEAEEEEA